MNCKFSIAFNINGLFIFNKIPYICEYFGNQLEKGKTNLIYNLEKKCEKSNLHCEHLQFSCHKKMFKLNFLNWEFIYKKLCFNRMSFICEYYKKPFEKSEKGKYAR